MLKAVIFDMDGVIVDTEPGHLKALIKAGNHFGLHLTIDYCSQFIGRSMPYLLSKIATDFHIDSDIASFKHSFETLFEQYKLEIRNEGLLPIEGTIRLIKSLHVYNIKVAIASSSTIKEIEDVIHSLQLESYIDCYVSGTMVPESKPCPDIFLLACKELNVLPEESIILEDSENGTIAAKRAGITCIGFQNKNSGNQNLREAAIIVEDTAYLDYEVLLEEFNRAHQIPVVITTTERLTIKELSIEDLPALYEIYQNPINTAFIPKMSSLEEEAEKLNAYIKNMYHFYRFGLWGIFENDSKKLIGRCGLEIMELEGESEIELGYLIDEPYQHKGYAYEAMTAILSLAKEYYELPYVVAVIPRGNTASIRLAKKLGLHYEKDCIHLGQDCLVYRIDF